MSKILNLLTNIIAFFIKNVNMLVGVVGALAKLAIAILHFWKPSQDNWVDKITVWSEKIQKFLFNASEVLKKFKG